MSEQIQVKELTEQKVADVEVNNQSQQISTAESDTPFSAEENINQINWRKFRQEREKERKAKEDSDRRANEKEREATALKAAMETLLNKNQQAPQRYEEEDETEEQRIEKKVNAVLERRERANEEDRRKREVADLPVMLTKTYSDFNTVCTEENLDYLEYHYPEVVAGYKNQPDSFDKWQNIYKAAKRFIPNTDSKKEQAKIEKNLSKPQSMSVPGSTQTGDHSPTQLSDKRRADNWNRMQRVLKGAK